VVLVRVDFTDQAGSKWRPAVVISTDHYNDASPGVLIASITGNLGAVSHPGDRRIRARRAAGLFRPSLAQTKIATVEALVIGRRLGALSERDFAAFKRGLREASDL